MRVEDTIREVPGGVEISVRCQPGAARTGIFGLHGDALKVKVKSPALEGRANKELVLLIADALGLRPHAVTLVSGEHSRQKRLRVDGISAADASKALRPFVTLSEESC